MEVTLNQTSAEDRAMRKDLVLSKIDERLEKSLMRINAQRNIYSETGQSNNDEYEFTQRGFDPLFNNFDNAEQILQEPYGSSKTKITILSQPKYVRGLKYQQLLDMPTQ